ncbi:MAG: NFACT RNA binding domain-containing protein [candidate division WOR-3 bacterium]
MFTGVVLHYLLKEFNPENDLLITDVVRKGKEISIVFGKKSITANLSPNAPYISLKKIKGEGFFSSFFKGKKVKKIEQVGLDRILIIELEENFKILFQIFGRRSDCLFFEGEKIFKSFKGIYEGEYVYPLLPEVINILTAEKEDIIEAIISKKKVAGLSMEFINKIREKGIDFVDSFANREFGPTVFEDVISPFVLPKGERFRSMNEAILYYFEKKEKEEELRRVKEEIEFNIQKKIEKAEGIIEKLSNYKSKKENYLLIGEALLTYEKKIEVSNGKVFLDYLGRKLEVDLFPSLSVKENAQRYFDLYKREKKRDEFIEKRKKELEKELEVLKKKKEKLKEAEDLKEFEKFYKKPEEEKEEIIPDKFRTFMTRNGFKVLVGKSAESNHELTFSYARPYDIFLHVKNAPGSHTILRVKDKNKYPPMEDIYDAAYYAAKFSKAKHSKVIPVSYTERRYVRGGKGLPKGTVILEREKVIYVSPESP